MKQETSAVALGAKKRASFSISEREYLLQVFDRDMFPTKETKIEVSRELGITLSQVSTWFANKRARHIG